MLRIGKISSVNSNEGKGTLFPQETSQREGHPTTERTECKRSALVGEELVGIKEVKESNESHVVKAAETAAASIKALLRHVQEERCVFEELRGLRVRGVLQLRVPSRSLEGAQDRLQEDQAGEERAREGERGSAEQRQWWRQWLGRHVRSDAGAAI